MALAPARELKIGRLVNKTLDVLEKNWPIALLFIVVLGAINSGMTYVGLTRTAISQQLGLTAASVIIGGIASYILVGSLLRGTGLKADAEGGHLVPFLGLVILYTLGVFFGFIVLVLPGLFVMARWSLATPLFIDRGGNVIKALSQSWDQTRGNEFPIIVAGLALAIVFIAISFGAPFLLGRETIVGLLVSQFAGSTMSVIFACFGVALYGLLVKAHEAKTFE